MMSVSHDALNIIKPHNAVSPSNGSEDDEGSVDAMDMVVDGVPVASSNDLHGHDRMVVHTPIAGHMRSNPSGGHMAGEADAEPDAEADPEGDDDSQAYVAATADMMDGAASASGTPRERHSLSLDQRRALRRWANVQTTRPSHKTCIEWFYNQYGQLISQSTVSHSLSPKYSRLDGDTPQLSGSRLRFGNWPDVEKVVLLWYQQVQASGRNPTNEELGEKAKVIFSQLPRYRDEAPPEFSPGWIHRFKKRYGLLIRRQRRHSDRQMDTVEDISYLADCVPRFMTVSADSNPALIRDSILKVVGVEPTLHNCVLIRDEVLRRAANPAVSVSAADAMAAAAAAGITPTTPTQQNPQGLLLHHQQGPHTHNHQQAHMHHPHPHPHQHQHQHPHQHQQPHQHHHQQPPGPAGNNNGSGPVHPMYSDDDDEAVLQSALQHLQAESAEVDVVAARDEHGERGDLNSSSLLDTPPNSRMSGGSGPLTAPTSSTRFSVVQDSPPADLSLTPSSSVQDRNHRCPFCLNQRVLRTIQEAIEHLSTHVVV